MASATSLMVIGILFACYVANTLSEDVFLRCSGLILLAILCFFLLFRFEINRRFRDQSLTLPHMLVAASVTLYAMYEAENARSVFLVLLLMIFLFGVLRLKARALITFAVGLLLAYGVVILLLFYFRPESLDLRLELLQWFAMALTLPWFAAMGAFISALRQRLRNNNVQLQSVLQQVQTSELKLALARASLVDAIESLGDAFSLFDSEDRLDLCNRKYVTSFTDFDCFDDIKGMHFEDLVRLSLAKGEVIEAAFAGDPEAWIEERMTRHRNPGSQVHELQLRGGLWFQISEQRTPSGGIVGVRRDISVQRQIEQRRAMEYTVTRVLSEAVTFDGALEKIIETICNTLGWDCGACWNHVQDKLHCVARWSIACQEVQQFMALSSAQDAAFGAEGLIRSVFSDGEPRSISDVATLPDFFRADSAAKAGLHGAFAFPIKIGHAMYGVMEFFIRDRRPSDPALLEVTRSIGSQIGQFIARERAENEIRQLAFYDPLTRLPNRRLLLDRIEHALAASIRSKRYCALLFIDLDHFKSINDTLGHDKGDLLLQQVAKRLSGCVRMGDTVARLGGDEMVVMLMDLSDRFDDAVAQTSAIGEKIRAALDAPYQFGSHGHHSTASIGATLFGGHLEASDELLKRADHAMYQAKAAGRNALRFFQADIDVAVSKRIALVS